MCAHIVYDTIQNGTVPIIFPVILQTIILAQLLSTGGDGAAVTGTVPTVMTKDLTTADPR